MIISLFGSKWTKWTKRTFSSRGSTQQTIQSLGVKPSNNQQSGAQMVLVVKIRLSSTNPMPKLKINQSVLIATKSHSFKVKQLTNEWKDLESWEDVIKLAYQRHCDAVMSSVILKDIQRVVSC